MPEDDRTEETYIHLAGKLHERGITYVHFNDEPVSIGHLNEDAVDNIGEPVVQGSGAKIRLIPPKFLREFRRRYRGGEPDTTLFYGGDDRGYTDYPAYSCRNPMLAHWSNRAR
jgi:hypothetical protein